MSEKELDWDKTPDMKVQTVSYFIRGVRTLWQLIASERKRIMLATAILFVVEALALCIPLFFKQLVDYLPAVLEKGITTSVVWIICAMFLVRVLVLVLKRFAQEPIILKALINLECHWPKMAQQKLLSLSLLYHERENTGRKIAKVNKGVEKMVAMLADLFWSLLPALFYLSINTVIILWLDWRLGALFLLPLVPVVFINLKTYRFAYPLWEEWEKKKEKSVGLFCQSIINVRTVQSFTSESCEEIMHGNIRNDMQKLDLGICLKMQKYFFAMEMVLGLSFICTIIVGLYFVYRGMGTIGTVAYIFITGNTTLESLWSIIQVYTRMLRDLVAAERMQILLSEEVDVANTAAGVKPEGPIKTIIFENASITYSGRTQSALEGLNLAMRPGQMYALVGRSGSGKSTLVNLLARVYDTTGGQVAVNGIGVREVDRDWYRRRFAFVPQDVEIFDGTIRQNIVYANPDATEEWVSKAVQASCLDEVVSSPARFPDGLQTQVGERGVRLSGGERQRVGIARAYIALLSGAEVLVLDEATASLDSQSERVVQKFIERLRKEKDIIIIAIAHRLSTIQKADVIYVLDSGRIIETGDHAQLLRKNGLYKRLVDLQKLGELRK
ncbi:MAG: ABC transporter ATP-binding protein [bacterium]|nr:ABC transporter ATP-binding protein [bacterium]